MKKLLLGASLFLLVSSCGGGQKQKHSLASDNSVTDSIFAANDSLVLLASEETAMVPTNADESFIDFLYNFSQNKRLQRARTLFPLSYHVAGKEEHIVEKEWKHDPLFSEIEAYTVIFDTAEEMELEKDESANEVKVEWIYLEQKEVKRYSFERELGEWKLVEMSLLPFTADEQAPESFYTFYHQFTADSLFQKRALANPLKFSTTNPEDEFEVIDTTMDYEQWLSYQSALPTFLTNVNYGQRLNAESRTKVLELKGFGNGFNNTLYFEKRGTQWKLVQYEDLGD